MPQKQIRLIASPEKDELFRSLPQHDDFSLLRRSFSVVSIVTVIGLLAFQSQRLIATIETVHWFVPLAVFGGVLAADFLSGLVHWSADTWGSESMPIIGRRLLHPFRVHHVNPDDFLRRSFVDTNGDVAFIVVPILVSASLIPLESTVQLAVAVSMTSFCGVGLLTNQVHQWAHMRHPPIVVKTLQNLGVILGRDAHAQHHLPPYVDNYCIATGWCNRPLTAIDFFRRLERLVNRVTGRQPRHDDNAFHADVEKQCPSQSVNELAVDRDRFDE